MEGTNLSKQKISRLNRAKQSNLHEVLRLDFSTHGDLNFNTPNLNGVNCLSQNLDLNMEGNGFSQPTVVSANVPYFPKILK